MKPGDLVQLPDGTVGYYQGTDKDGRARVLIEFAVPAKELKKYKGKT